MVVLAKAVYERLTEHVGLSGLVSTRVYASHAPQDVTFPVVVYQIISERRESAMGADTGNVRARVQIDSWAEDYLSARNVSEQVRAALQRIAATEASIVIDSVFLDDDAGEDSYEEQTERYRVRQDFLVWYRE